MTRNRFFSYYLVDLEDCNQCSLEIITLELFGVEDLDGMLPTF